MDIVNELRKKQQYYQLDELLLRAAAEIESLRAELAEHEKALDAVWVNDGKWSYETHQEWNTGVNGFTIATGDIEANTYKRLVHNAESPLDAILAAMQEGKK